MKRRTKAQWLSLIQEFEKSGLTQSAFCAEHGLNPKYFSLRRMKLKACAESRPFIQAVVSAGGDRERVVIHYGKVTVQLPVNATQTIVELVKALAA